MKAPWKPSPVLFRCCVKFLTKKLLPHFPPGHEQFPEQPDLGCVSSKSKATNRMVWLREQFTLSEKETSMIRAMPTWSDYEYFYSPLDGILRGYPPALNSPVLIYTPWVERDTVRVKFLAQQHNAISPIRARTPNVRSRRECLLRFYLRGICCWFVLTKKITISVPVSSLLQLLV